MKTYGLRKAAVGLMSFFAVAAFSTAAAKEIADALPKLPPVELRMLNVKAAAVDSLADFVGSIMKVEGVDSLSGKTLVTDGISKYSVPDDWLNPYAPQAIGPQYCNDWIYGGVSLVVEPSQSRLYIRPDNVCVEIEYGGDPFSILLGRYQDNVCQMLYAAEFYEDLDEDNPDCLELSVNDDNEPPVYTITYGKNHSVKMRNDLDPECAYQYLDMSHITDDMLWAIFGKDIENSEKVNPWLRTLENVKNGLELCTNGDSKALYDEIVLGFDNANVPFLEHILQHGNLHGDYALLLDAHIAFFKSDLDRLARDIIGLWHTDPMYDCFLSRNSKYAGGAFISTMFNIYGDQLLEKVLSNIPECEPSFPELGLVGVCDKHDLRAMAYKKAGKYDEAYKELENAYKVRTIGKESPEEAIDRYATLADCKNAGGHFKEAGKLVASAEKLLVKGARPFASSLVSLGLAAFHAGDLDKAIELTKRAYDYEWEYDNQDEAAPQLAVYYRLKGDYNEELKCLDKILDNIFQEGNPVEPDQIEPGVTYLLGQKALALKWLGREEEARKIYDQVKYYNGFEQTENLPVECFVAAALGDRENAHRIIEIYEQQGADKGNNLLFVACAYGKLGDQEKSFNALDSALRYHFMGPGLIKFDPDLELARNHPRFQEMIRNYYPEYKQG